MISDPDFRIVLDPSNPVPDLSISEPPLSVAQSLLEMRVHEREAWKAAHPRVIIRKTPWWALLGGGAVIFTDLNTNGKIN